MTFGCGQMEARNTARYSHSWNAKTYSTNGLAEKAHSMIRNLESLSITPTQSGHVNLSTLLDSPRVLQGLLDAPRGGSVAVQQLALLLALNGRKGCQLEGGKG